MWSEHVSRMSISHDLTKNNKLTFSSTTFFISFSNLEIIYFVLFLFQLVNKQRIDMNILQESVVELSRQDQTQLARQHIWEQRNCILLSIIISMSTVFVPFGTKRKKVLYIIFALLYFGAVTLHNTHSTRWRLKVWCCTTIPKFHELVSLVHRFILFKIITFFFFKRSAVF